MFVRFVFFVGYLLQFCVVNGQESDSLTTQRINDLWKRNYSDHVTALIDIKKQEIWINQKMLCMRDTLDVATLEYAEPNIINIPDLQKVSYKIKSCQNIQMLDSSHVSICVHSAHQDPKIGDVCIGKTSENVYFVNYGHVCGGLINFERMALSIPNDSLDFFNSFVSDTDGHTWIPISIKK
jgi:hypothetical protein